MYKLNPKFVRRLYKIVLYINFADHPGLEPGTLELTALCSAIELMVIGRPSTDLSQVWTLVPEVPTLTGRLKRRRPAGWSCGLGGKEPLVGARPALERSSRVR